MLQNDVKKNGVSVRRNFRFDISAKSKVIVKRLWGAPVNFRLKSQPKQKKRENIYKYVTMQYIWPLWQSF
jgi:hypothetical protein